MKTKTKKPDIFQVGKILSDRIGIMNVPIITSPEADPPCLPVGEMDLRATDISDILRLLRDPRLDGVQFAQIRNMYFIDLLEAKKRYSMYPLN